MSIARSSEVILEIIPTIFPQYNSQHHLPADHETTKLSVKRIKHRHLRALQKLSENDQIHFLMTELTGLTQDDLDELDVEDSAKLSEVIFGFMRRYADIAREMARG